MKNAHFDAIVLPVALAHEKFGGKPVFERVQILDAGSQSHAFIGNPNFVVTTVPYPGNLEIVVDAEGKRTLKIVPKTQRSLKDISYLLFKSVLRAIDEFNTSHPDSIKTVLFDLEVIGFAPEAAAEEAEGARTAITEHRLLPEPASSSAPAAEESDPSTARRGAGS
ncbi:hypothetical protein A5481_00340 [Methylobacterium platani]|uniref:Uncharacterized protein n=1 Tax=Methylobacterium platani TaxID=427683 RepID=A0A179SLA0_9HYPH|nr:hypothetical protein A5481_00340 [Methylobacterium platani]